MNYNKQRLTEPPSRHRIKLIFKFLGKDRIMRKWFWEEANYPVKDLGILIFSYINTYQDWFAVRSVNTLWRDLSRNPIVLQHIMLNCLKQFNEALKNEAEELEKLNFSLDEPALPLPINIAATSICPILTIQNFSLEQIQKALFKAHSQYKNEFGFISLHKQVTVKMAFQEYVEVSFADAHKLCRALKVMTEINNKTMSRLLPQKRILAYHLTGMWKSVMEMLIILSFSALLISFAIMPSETVGKAFIFFFGVIVLTTIFASLDKKFLAPLANEERDRRWLLHRTSDNSRSSLFKVIVDTVTNHRANSTIRPDF